MNSLSIRARLIGFIVISTIGLIIIGGVGWYGMKMVNDKVDIMVNQRIPAIKAAYDIRIDMSDVRLSTYGHTTADTSSELERREQRLAENTKSLQTAIQTYEALIASPEERRTFDEMNVAMKNYDDIIQKILIISRDLNRKQEAQNELRNNTRDSYEAVTAKMYALRDLNIEQIKETEQSAEDTLAQANAILVGVFLAISGLLITLGLYVSRSVQQGTSELTRVFNSLSKLDLRTRSKSTSDDEIGKVLKQYNNTVTELTNVVQTTQEASHTVSAAALELTAGMESITTTTRHQEDALTSIAASLEQTSVSAQEVNTKAQRSGKATDEIVHAIGEAVQNVGELSNNATAIGSVLEMIKGISDQINLLSLNAAIEAARAGDAGRGFAVVADEVRKLATSVTTSTDQIATVVGELQNSVSRTKQTLDRVGNELDEVRSNSESVVSAVSQQTVAVNTISQSIGEFRNQMATVLNSVQEAQVASNSLSQSAENLNSQTGRFQV